jgi:zinc transport system ATP-binding protein
MSSPVIEISDLWFSYNAALILENVNLTVAKGDFLAIIGPNGGGKTTLIKLMLGLLAPDRGTVRLLDRSPYQAAPEVGYVPQNTNANTGIPVSVEQVVLMGTMHGGGGWRRFTPAMRRAAREALERVGMWTYRHRRMNELSQGQRQRVFVARAMVADPSILILDEPTANVDTEGQTELYDYFNELNKTVTIVVVSHDTMVLSTYVKSVACVNRQVHFHDRPEITADMLEGAYQCPVELIAHGLPHRVLCAHDED